MIHAIELLLTVGLLGDASLKDLSVRDTICLAQNVYHEARGEAFEGRSAVAHVTLNRVADARWPDSICAVVYQSGQFSWTRKAPSINDPVAYENALMVAIGAMTGLLADPTDGATYFFNKSAASPGWSRSFETVAVIGDHTFLR